MSDLPGRVDDPSNQTVWHETTPISTTDGEAMILRRDGPHTQGTFNQALQDGSVHSTPPIMQ